MQFSPVPIRFDEPAHQYFAEGGQQLMSVTTVISQFSPVFNAEEKARWVAKSTGKHVNKVLESWREAARLGRERGSWVHKELEEAILKYDPFDFAVGLDEPQWIQDVLSCIPQLCREDCEAHPEVICASVGLGWAGTADLVVLSGRWFYLYDFKTNREIKKEAHDGKETLLGMCNHLPNCNYSKYTLQLAIYMHLIENTEHTVTGEAYHCKGAAIIHIDKEDQVFLHPFDPKYLRSLMLDEVDGVPRIYAMSDAIKAKYPTVN